MRKQNAPDEETSVPAKQAQELIYDAWEEDDEKRRIELAVKAMLTWPDCADAYVVLAEDLATSLDSSTEFCQKGVEAGERAIGKEQFKKWKGHFWGITETRPYMRARASLAQCLWETGQHEETISHYRAMLRLNPGDNQGIRYLLLGRLVDMGHDADAERLMQQYGPEGCATWTYTAALLRFRKEGDSETSCSLLAVALKQNRHAADFLLGRKKLPEPMPYEYTLGSREEAALYAADCAGGWKKTSGAMAWLAKSLDKSQTRQHEV